MTSEKFIILQTEYGPVKGIEKCSALGRVYFNFQGIPYMKAPIGKLRFRDAQAPETWTEPLDATKEPASYVALDFTSNTVSGKEDAGIINVYTHDVEPTKLKPVMVWIHGGGFITGSSKTNMYGPDFLLQKDVVVVSFNYRCGVLGFLSLDDPKLGVPGNAGLKDQVVALKWVRKNIKNFGGDPLNVTIFGESAGGGSVHYHMISKASKGLFQKAIPMSGVAFNKSWTCIPRRNYAVRLAKLLKYEGSLEEKDILEFLEGCKVEDFLPFLFTTMSDEESLGEHILAAYMPCIEPYESENCFIPKDPVLMAREAWGNDIPCMIGGTSFEEILRANFMKENVVKVLQNFNYFAPLLDLGLTVNSPKAAEYGKRIKEVYYGLLKPSVPSQEAYLYFQCDNMFWHGIQRAVQSRIKSGGKGKTFLYRFDVVTEQNFVKKWVKAEELPGASHGDDLNYLWKHDDYYPCEQPKVGSIEFEMIMKMVEIVTGFAITGNPSISWEPVTSVDLPLPCLNITEKGLNMIPLPETERLVVWDSVYRDEGVALF